MPRTDICDFLSASRRPHRMEFGRQKARPDTGADKQFCKLDILRAEDRSSCCVAQWFDAKFNAHASLRQHVYQSVNAEQFNLAFQELVESRLGYAE